MCARTPRPSRSQYGVLAGLRVKLIHGLSGTNERPTSVPTPLHEAIAFHDDVRGSQTRGKLIPPSAPGFANRSLRSQLRLAGQASLIARFARSYAWQARLQTRGAKASVREGCPAKLPRQRRSAKADLDKMPSRRVVWKDERIIREVLAACKDNGT